jgi:prepilin-type N-terminal cleavage/methylation domain-containing protein
MSIHRSTQRAFTLVEMLVVIIIIGILAVALIPRLTAVQSRARDVARKWDIQQLVVWLASYEINTNTYPSWSGSVSQALGMLSPLYLRSLPTDPSRSISTTNWSQSALWEYLYISFDTDQGYALISVNEWWWVNANRVSHSTSNSLTGTNSWAVPWRISSSDSADSINRSLCMSVQNGVLWRIGNLCTASLSAHQVKYIVVTK